MLIANITLWSEKKRTLLISAVILSLFIVAGLVGTLKDASAGGVSVGPKEETVNLYFRGDGSLPYKLGSSNYGLLTIKYDGDTICKDLRISNRLGFGGFTSGRVKEKRKVFVKIKIYDRNGTSLGSKEWEKNLHDGDTPDYWYSPNQYCAFEMHLKRSGTTVSVQFL